MDAEHAAGRFPAPFLPHLVLQPSRLAPLLMAAPVLLALVLAISDSHEWRLPLAVLLLLWLPVWWWNQHQARARVLGTPDGCTWVLQHADGRCAYPRLTGHAVLGTLAVQLIFRVPGQPGWLPSRQVIIWRDAVSHDEFRRLCVFLRLGGSGMVSRLPFV